MVSVEKHKTERKQDASQWMLVAGAVEQERTGAKAMLTWLLCFFLCFSAIPGFLKITKYMKNLALLLFACIVCFG